MEISVYLESAGEFPPNPAGEELHKLLIVHVKELVQIHAAVGELSEGPLLLQIHHCICVIGHDVVCKVRTLNNLPRHL